MEITKVSKPAPVYQGSGPEAVAKAPAVTVEPAAQQAVAQPQVKAVPDGSVKQKAPVAQDGSVRQKAPVAQDGSVKARAVSGLDPQTERKPLGVEEEEDRNALQESQEAANNKALKRAVEEVNRKVKNNELIFGIHDATNRVTIKVVDRNTKEVIREIPPEETLDMIAKVWELAGIMIDEKG